MSITGVAPTPKLSFNPLVTNALAGVSASAEGVNTIVGEAEAVVPTAYSPLTKSPFASSTPIVCPSIQEPFANTKEAPLSFAPVNVTLLFE